MTRLLLAATISMSCTIATAADAPATAKSAEKYRTFAMTHAGDAGKGKDLFNDAKRLACGRCHAAVGAGGKVGPDLSAAGDKFGRLDLVNSILDPSASIADGFATTIITTKAGDTIDGIVRESTKARVTLMLADGTLSQFVASDITARRVSEVSMMPAGLHEAVTLQEFTDLIEYVATLKSPDAAGPAARGMPAVIPESARPVQLIPLNDKAHRFAHPVWFGSLPGVAGGFVVVEHESGKVWRWQPGAAETKGAFLEAGRNQPGAHGIMSVVFHPGFASNRRYFFIDQRVGEKGLFYSRVCECVAAADLKSDSGTPPHEILRIDNSSANHCGGGLEFGPDGFLYIAMGDTGPQQDPHGNAQDMTSLRGKMLRIDVDHAAAGKAYAVPADNPFVGRAGVRPEVWAVGLREPWRYSFDLPTGDLWVGDVGQDLYEEVDVVRRGENYGWNVIEGFAPFSNQYRRAAEQYSPPVLAYGRKYGVSVTGGYVYRADAKSALYGAYIFADFQTRRIFALTQAEGKLTKVRQIGMSPERVVSFARDEAGGLYLVGYEGTIFRMDLSGASFE